MATYLEIYNIKDDPSYGDFAKKVAVAVAIKAHAIANDGAATTAQKEWARSALSGPDSQRQIIEHYIYADNNGATIAQILGATDTQIQTAVNASVDGLLGA